jgi:hypothetical protein
MPITGIAGCCARATTGQATAALPIRVMKSRRRMCAPLVGSLPYVVTRSPDSVGRRGRFKTCLSRCKKGWEPFPLTPDMQPRPG